MKAASEMKDNIKQLNMCIQVERKNIIQKEIKEMTNSNFPNLVGKNINL